VFDRNLAYIRAPIQHNGDSLPERGDS